MGETHVMDRERAVQRYLHGESATAICASLGCSRAWLYRWLARYVTDDPTWATSRSRAPHRRPQAVASAVRDEILRARTRLADAGVTRPRRAGPYQPKGTPYPAPVAATPSAVHQSDFVGPCRLRGAPRFYSLHSVDVATGRVAVEPLGCRQAQAVINAFWASWQRLGLPTIQQIDNEPVFYGNRARPRGFGPLIRLCLSVGVQPWFIPVAEPWRNGVVERFNDWWRQKGPLTRLVLPDHAASSIRQLGL